MWKIFIVLCMLATSTTVIAGELEDAVAALERGDFETGTPIMQKLASQGDAAAQLNLGAMYSFGKGVAQDHKEVVKWFRRSADQGEAEAIFILGQMYENGQGVPQDHGQAANWYEQGAKQGNGSAQLSLGVLYAKGLGVPQDNVAAHMWLHIAATQGNIAAQVTRDTIAKDMTNTQITTARQRARQWISDNRR